MRTKVSRRAIKKTLWFTLINLFSEKTLSKKAWLRIERGELILVLMMFTYTVVFSYFTVLKHYAFRTNAWDVGGFAQAFWTTLRYGKVFEYNVEFYLTTSKSFFGVHFSPILYLVLPFYALYPHVESLLVIQSAVLALGALPTYLLARDTLNSRITGLGFAAIYLLSPLLQGVNWFDFHLEAFLPFEYLFAIYFFKKKDYVGYILFILLVLMTLEQMTIINVFLAFSLLLMFRREVVKEVKNRVITGRIMILLLTIVISIIWAHFASAVQAYYNPVPPIELKGAGAFVVLGVDEPSQIPFYVLTHPDETLNALRYDWYLKLYYLVLLFSPTLFLSLLSIELILPALPWLGVMLISNYPPYYLPGLQYAGIVIPFVMASSIFGLKFITHNIASKIVFLKRIMLLMLIVNVLFSIVASPLSIFYIPGTYHWARDYGMPKIEYHHKVLLKMIRLIPDNAIVLTQDRIFPHLASNINAYVIPPVTARLEKVYDKIIKELKEAKPEYIIIDPLIDVDTASFVVKEFVANKEFSLIGFADGALLFKRGNESLKVNEPALFYFKNLFTAGGKIVSDPTSTFGKAIAFIPTYYYRDVVWFGPYLVLPPGDYKVTFRIKTDKKIDNLLITLDVVSSRGKKLLALRNVYGDEVQENIWTNISLIFHVDSYEYYVEFRGINPSNNTNIYLDYIKLEYLGHRIWKTEKIVINYTNVTYYFNRIVSDPTSMSGKVIEYERSSRGKFFISYPITLSAGVYRADIYLKTENSINAEDHLFDLFLVHEKENITIRPIYGLDSIVNNLGNKWFKITLYFSANENGYSKFVFQGINVNNSIRIDFDSIIITKIREKYTPIYHMVFDAGKLFASKGVTYKNTIRHVYNQTAGVVWFGPYVTLPPGKYKVTYWIKLNRADEDHVIDLDIAANMGKTIIVKKSLYKQDFPALNKWINITLTFTSNTRLVDVEFRGFVRIEKVDISLIYIEVIGWKY